MTQEISQGSVPGLEEYLWEYVQTNLSHELVEEKHSDDQETQNPPIGTCRVKHTENSSGFNAACKNVKLLF